MIALKIASIALISSALTVALLALGEAGWRSRNRLKSSVGAFFLRAWCACPSTWAKSILKRLGRK